MKNTIKCYHEWHRIEDIKETTQYQLMCDFIRFWLWINRTTSHVRYIKFRYKIKISQYNPMCVEHIHENWGNTNDTIRNIETRENSFKTNIVTWDKEIHKWLPKTLRFKTSNVVALNGMKRRLFHHGGW